MVPNEDFALPDQREMDLLIQAALAEDIGAFDVTSVITIPEEVEISFAIKARQQMVVCGIELASRVFDNVAPGIHKYVYHAEGSWIKPGDVILGGHGNARAIFAAERVALNLLRHTCGVATVTQLFVKKIEGTKAKILDTRKTIPGLRSIQKYAVRVGGGMNHRFRLDDRILIKDNHISVCGSVTEALHRAKKSVSSSARIEVECDTLPQVQEAIEGEAGIILLDNMDIAQLKEAVALVNGRAVLEASGNVSLENVLEIAKTGVDYISVGMITHSTPNVDIGLDLE
jgi:nicotinate-nucleotide pyrophosphorylase (carboxylating)